MTKPKTGNKYNLQAMTFLGWFCPDANIDLEGYTVEEYFSATGRYKGPDSYGVEPLFDELAEYC